jgi:nucleotide-binding universal stress UspA family protein
MVLHVAVGIDGTPESLAAAHWAAREAVRRGGGLRLVHAWEWQPHPAAYVPADMSQREWAVRILARASAGVRAAHPGLAVEERPVEGTEVTALLRAAGDAELLVLGSHGLGGLVGFLVGSVSQRVVARAEHPVVLVRGGGSAADEHLPVPDGVSPEEIPGLPYRDVVLGLDVRTPGDEVVRFAFEAARRRAAPLRVIHAVAGVPGGAGSPDAGALTERERGLIAALRPWHGKYPEVAATGTLVEGRAGSELVRAAAGASLVVVGRRARDRRGGGTHLGAVTHAVLHHARCPVAVVPHT